MHVHAKMWVRLWVQINAHSSRSHCLLIINVIGTNRANGVRTVGKLTLCDLAGSERINKTGATGGPHPHPSPAPAAGKSPHLQLRILL